MELYPSEKQREALLEREIGRRRKSEDSRYGEKKIVGESKKKGLKSPAEILSRRREIRGDKGGSRGTEKCFKGDVLWERSVQGCTSGTVNSVSERERGQTT